MQEEEIVTQEEVVAENVDTTVEEVAEIVGSVGEEVVPETVTDESLDVATEVVETVEEVA